MDLAGSNSPDDKLGGLVTALGRELEVQVLALPQPSPQQRSLGLDVAGLGRALKLAKLLVGH